MKLTLSHEAVTMEVVDLTCNFEWHTFDDVRGCCGCRIVCKVMIDFGFIPLIDEGC